MPGISNTCSQLCHGTRATGFFSYALSPTLLEIISQHLCVPALRSIQEHRISLHREKQQSLLHVSHFLDSSVVGRQLWERDYLSPLPVSWESQNSTRPQLTAEPSSQRSWLCGQRIQSARQQIQRANANWPLRSLKNTSTV